MERLIRNSQIFLTVQVHIKHLNSGCPIVLLLTLNFLGHQLFLEKAVVKTKQLFNSFRTKFAFER